MKHYYKLFVLISFLSFFFSLNSFSQTPPQLSGALFASAGLKDYVIYFKPTSILSEGASGANVNWDLSSFQDAYNVLLQNVTPGSTPYSTNFPAATDAEIEPLPGGDTIFTYHLLNSSTPSYSELGSYRVSTHTMIIYSKPRVIAAAPGPSHYGDSISNTYSANGTFDSAGVSGTIARHGIIKRYYESYGNLKTSWHTFSNVARIKTVEQYTDSVIISGVLSIHTVDVINFIWSEAINPVREASITHTTRDGITTHKGFYECSICIVGIEPAKTASHDLLIYPQPAADMAIVKYYVSNAGENNITLTDATGKIVMMKKQWMNEGSNTFELNTSGLANGVYLLRISDEENVVTKKLAIDHR